MSTSFLLCLYRYPGRRVFLYLVRFRRDQRSNAEEIARLFDGDKTNVAGREVLESKVAMFSGHQRSQLASPLAATLMISTPNPSSRPVALTQYGKHPENRTSRRAFVPG